MVEELSCGLKRELTIVIDTHNMQHAARVSEMKSNIIPDPEIENMALRLENRTVATA